MALPLLVSAFLHWPEGKGPGNPEKGHGDVPGDGNGLLAAQDARGAGKVGQLAESRMTSASHRHHTHITDIAENAVNAIISTVEGLGGDSLPSQY